MTRIKRIFRNLSWFSGSPLPRSLYSCFRPMLPTAVLANMPSTMDRVTSRFPWSSCGMRYIVSMRYSSSSLSRSRYFTTKVTRKSKFYFLSSASNLFSDLHLLPGVIHMSGSMPFSWYQSFPTPINFQTKILCYISRSRGIHYFKRVLNEELVAMLYSASIKLSSKCFISLHCYVWKTWAFPAVLFVDVNCSCRRQDFHSICTL